MDRLLSIEIFVAVADAGGLSRAARRLRLSAPTVTRAIAALEERLGARVFHRTTRRLSLTDAGQRFLLRARRILSELGDAQNEAAGEVGEPQGHLVLTAPVTLGRLAVAPIVCTFLKAYPRVSASVRMLDRVVNLSDEGIDAAIRVGPMPDSSLIARRVGSIRRVLVASPTYIARHGRPQVPSDLKKHTMIAFSGLATGRTWRFAGGSVSLSPRLELNDAAAAIAAAEGGNGITMAFSYAVSAQLRKGRLVRLLDAYAPPEVPVHFVYPQSGLVAPKVRAFADFAAPRLKEMLAQLALP